MNHDFQTIKYEKDENAVGKIVLNRPSSFNAFTQIMNQEIIRALKMAGKDENVRSIVITGAGKAFCSGQDLGEVDDNTDFGEFLRNRYHPMVRAIKQTPKPSIAAVNGTAAGAGMSLALAADFRLVKPESKFVSAFMNIGLIPDSGFLYYLPRLIGYAKAFEIATLGKPISGEEAFELGLATEIIDQAEWDEKVHAFAEKIALMPTKSVSLVKRYMIDGMNMTFEEMLEKEAQAQSIAGNSNDHKEGLQSFKEKRKTQFNGN